MAGLLDGDINVSNTLASVRLLPECDACMQELSASYPICFQGGHNHVMIAAFVACIACCCV